MKNDMELFDELKMRSLIEDLLTTKQRYHQEKLVQKIALVKDEKTAEIVARLLYSEDAYIRNIAIELLVLLDEKAIPVLKEKLADKDRNIRKFVLDALKHVKGKQSCEIALKALDDEDENVVVAALEVIAEQQYKQAQDKLEKILEKTNSVWIINGLLRTFDSLNIIDCVEVIEKKIDSLNGTYMEKNILMNTYVRTLGNIGSLSDIEKIIAYSKDFIIDESNIIFGISNLIVNNEITDLSNEVIDKLNVMFKEHWDYKDLDQILYSIPALIKLQMDFFLNDVKKMVQLYGGQEFFVENLYESILKMEKVTNEFINEILSSQEPQLIMVGLKLIYIKQIMGHKSIVEELCNSEDQDISISAIRIITEMDSYKNTCVFN